VGICFLFHPLIGTAAAFGALILIGFTFAAEAVTRSPAKAAAGLGGARNALLEASRRNAEVMQATGMGSSMSARVFKPSETFCVSEIGSMRLRSF